MNFREKNITIGSVVAELPKASKIFGGYGIDFCCGGHRNLDAVIREQGIPAEEIYQALEEAQREREDSYRDISLNSMSPTALSTYIEDRHHSYLREALPEIADLLSTILRVHGSKHKELFEVYRLYGMLKSDLEQHLLREETMLFPAFENEADHREEISELSAIIIGEHEAAGEVLEKLRHATGHYHIPEDVCGTFRKTYELLEELEQDLHEHIHLENNILLKQYDTRGN
ncbi:MAG TPA: iron-sulfur cluster repair di-iron protein [Clostridiales bacterium]|nr:iron-sulfur cluster repair di-iron protein [Clostridiales bacterium]